MNSMFSINKLSRLNYLLLNASFSFWQELMRIFILTRHDSGSIICFRCLLMSTRHGVWRSRHRRKSESKLCTDQSLVQFRSSDLILVASDTRELILIPSFCQDEDCTMQGVMKLARSGSLLVEEIFGGRRRSHQAEVDPAEITYESGFNGKIVHQYKRVYKLNYKYILNFHLFENWKLKKSSSAYSVKHKVRVSLARAWWGWRSCRRSCGAPTAGTRSTGRWSTAGRATSAADTAGQRIAAAFVNRHSSTPRMSLWIEYSHLSTFLANTGEYRHCKNRPWPMTCCVTTPSGNVYQRWAVQGGRVRGERGAARQARAREPVRVPARALPARPPRLPGGAHRQGHVLAQQDVLLRPPSTQERAAKDARGQTEAICQNSLITFRCCCKNYLDHSASIITHIILKVTFFHNIFVSLRN